MTDAPAPDKASTAQAVLRALAHGTITEHEADVYLHAKCGMSLTQARAANPERTPVFVGLPMPTAAPEAPPVLPSIPLSPLPAPAVDPVRPTEKRYKAAPILAVTIIVLLAFGIFLMPASPAGLITFNPGIDGVTTGSYPVPESVVGINITGYLTGEGSATVQFVSDTGTYLVGTVTSDTGAPRTDRASYAAGDMVDVEHAPADATYYVDDGVLNTPVTVPFGAPIADATLLVVTPSETYRLPIIIGTALRTTAFNELCGESCTMPEANGSLVITVTEGAALTVTSVQAATTAVNSPPVGLALPQAVVDGNVTLDLSPYATDPDGDAVYFSAGTSDLVETMMDGTSITLTPIAAGNGTLSIYASDLVEIIELQLPITVALPAAIVEPLNETAVNETAETPPIPDTNTTTNETSPADNGTVVLDCSAPDPNDRPVDCLNQDAEYFDEIIVWENMGRERVARFSPIGNLLITGRVYAATTAIPPDGAFTIGYKDDFTYIPTIWVDDAGNLHLRGQLHEENANLDPLGGSYRVMNRRGIYLAYADMRTGDLYVRGNVIPYRSSI
jgi:hypothetical protein